MGLLRQWGSSTQHQTYSTPNQVLDIPEDKEVKNGRVVAAADPGLFVLVGKIEEGPEEVSLLVHLLLDPFEYSVKDKRDGTH